MTLLLTNEDLEGLFSIQECMTALELMYRNFSKGLAAELDRIDAMLPLDRDNAYNFKTMIGIDPDEGVVALRVVSDMINWTDRRVKIPVAPGGRWVGLIFLFSTRHTRLLAIVQDGYLQSFRVGATTGLGAKYLAREDAKIYGLIGTGQQANAQLDAIVRVRPIERVKVFSPNKAHRVEFVRKWRKKLGIEVVAVSSSREAVEHADIVGCATNSVESVVNGEWIEEGMHVTCIRPTELAESVFKCVDKCFAHSLDWAHRPKYEVIGSRNELGRFIEKDLKQGSDLDLNQSSMRELKDLVGGLAPGRVSDKEITCFYNNVGIGLQLEAVAALAYKKATEKGLGKELPDNWFSQNLHS